jgi:glycerophosphoryl diester phosphodiesterase
VAKPRTILVHAHRGGRAFRPENTLAAFEYGIEVGADVLELDLACTRDDVLVVSHSPFMTQPEVEDPEMRAELARERQCEGPLLPPGSAIRALTLAEVKQYDCGARTVAAFRQQVTVPGARIPTFDEVLELASKGTSGFGGIQLNVEVKSFPAYPELTPLPEEFARMVNEAVARRGLESEVIVQSFDFRVLDAMRKVNPGIRLAALFGQSRYDALMGIDEPDKSFEGIARRTGAEILAPDECLVTLEEVAWAHGMGLQVVPYTVNDEAGWRRMADARVDAIITDDPAGLLVWLRAQKPPLHP